MKEWVRSTLAWLLDKMLKKGLEILDSPYTHKDGMHEVMALNINFTSLTMLRNQDQIAHYQSSERNNDISSNQAKKI